MPDDFTKTTGREVKFHDLTEEEYDALDEKWTKNPPKPGPNGTGFFAMRKATLAVRKGTTDVVDDMEREQMAAAL
jgi:hypothetical protein